MARIVCQVVHRPNRITFLWSEGTASFEPVYLEGEERTHFLRLAQQIYAGIAGAADGVELAQLGHQFYRALFRLDAGGDAVNSLHTWFSNLARDNRIETLEFLCDDPARFPWNALLDEIPSAASLKHEGEGWQRFFGARFNLAVGSRVNALRQFPILENATPLLAADPSLIERLADTLLASVDSFRSAGTLQSTVETFGDALKQSAPEVVLLLARFEQGQLWLGRDLLSLTEMRDWLQQTKDANPDPAVILMAVGNPAEQNSWQTFLAEATRIFSGIIANEVLLPAEQIFSLASKLAGQFVQGKQTIATELRTLRPVYDSAGLAWSAFCPPDLRIARADTESQAPATQLLPLPDAPFHPFAAYTADDRPLFFGRQEETIACAAVIDQAETRGVFLHGGPAVGKTSLLQAGLLPYLEQESVGYRVLRDRTPVDGGGPTAESDYPILVLRCTEDLAGQLADALTVFCAQPFTYTTPLGSQVTVDLPNLLYLAVTGQSKPTLASTAIQLDTTKGITADTIDDADEADEEKQEPALSAKDLWIALRDQRELLATLLDEITRSLPFELVIVVDQGEELITLVKTPHQQARRQKAIDMLLQTVACSARCKLIFTLRSHFLGELISLLPQGRTPDNWRVYFLAPLGESKMADALLWPTNREEIPYSDEVPHQKYGFAFEDGMAQQLAASANEAAAAELVSPLPLLQAIGALLYEVQVREKHQNVVRTEDLKQFGPLKDVLMKYLDRCLVRLPILTPSRKALRALLPKLYKSHTDGTISRNLLPAKDLDIFWLSPHEVLGEVINKATAEEGLFEIQNLLIGGQQDTYVSLPQDGLAQLGRKIDEESKLQAYAKTKIIDVLWIMIPMAFFAAALSFFLTRNFMAPVARELDPETQKKIQELLVQAGAEGAATSKIQARPPMYVGLIAQADQALQAGNALRARQLLVSQPAMRSFAEQDKKDKLFVSDLRGFEWKYLWRYLNSERHLFEGHRSVVSGVAVSPDSRFAASCSYDGTIRIWNLSRGEIVALLGDPRQFSVISAVAFSPDGNTLASAGADKIVRLWDIKTLSDPKTDYVEIPTETKSLSGQSDAVYALSFGKDANTLASGGADKTVILWDVARGQVKFKLDGEHKQSVQALAFIDDGKTLISAGEESKMIVWEVETGKKKSEIPTPHRTVSSLAVSADGKTLASGGGEMKLDAELGVVRFWDAGSFKETLPAIQHSSGVLALGFLPDAKTPMIASSGKDSFVRLWDASTGKELRHWFGHVGWAGSLAFARDGSALVTGSYDQTVKVWNPEQSSGPDVIPAHADWVQCLALGRKDTLLASGSRDGAVKLWDPQNGKMLLNLPALKGAVTAVALSSHTAKTLLAAATRDESNIGEIKVWELEKEKDVWKAKDLHTLKNHRLGVTALAFSPLATTANTLISASADTTVIQWDAETGKEKNTFRRHSKEVRCITFGSDGHSFLTAGKDLRVCLYDLESNQSWLSSELHLAAIEATTYLNLPGGANDEVDDFRNLLCTVSADQTMRHWMFQKREKDLLHCEEKYLFRAHTLPLTSVISNKGFLATGSWDRSIKLYSTRLPYERFTLLGHTGAVRALAMASDQSFLVSASNDGTLRFWRATQDRTAVKAEVK